jgi:hypothetical protein
MPLIVAASGGSSLDVPGLQECAHAIRARHAVDVVVVVVLGELPEVVTVAGLQIGVESLLPRFEVDLGGLREDAVEIEQQRRDVIRETEHGVSVPGNRPEDVSAA